MNRMGSNQDGCGTRKTDSSMTCFAARTASAAPPENSLHGGPAAACRVAIFEEDALDKLPLVRKRIRVHQRHPELAANLHMPTRPVQADGCSPLVNEDKLRRILSRMLDENEFLGPYGIRALSRYHLDIPTFSMSRAGVQRRLSARRLRHGMFGGNSNWRGPVWMPVNFMLYLSLLRLDRLLRRLLQDRVPHRFREI